MIATVAGSRYGTPSCALRKEWIPTLSRRGTWHVGVLGFAGGRQPANSDHVPVFRIERGKDKHVGKLTNAVAVLTPFLLFLGAVVSWFGPFEPTMRHFILA